MYISIVHVHVYLHCTCTFSLPVIDCLVRKRKSVIRVLCIMLVKGCKCRLDVCLIQGICVQCMSPDERCHHVGVMTRRMGAGRYNFWVTDLLECVLDIHRSLDGSARSTCPVTPTLSPSTSLAV